MVATAAFLLVESGRLSPILPLHLFRNRNFSLVAALSFLVGLAMFGAITFLPLYQQTVQGASATVSGLLLTPMMVGVMVTSIVAGPDHQPDRPVQGAAHHRRGGHGRGHVPAVDARRGDDQGDLRAVLVVLGLGMGLLMQITSVMAQNSVALKDIGVASSSRLFFQQIGGSIGVVGIRRDLRQAAAPTC